MIKSNLPVMLLKGLILLPYQEARIELNNEISKKVIEISKLYHDGEVLIVTPLNTLEENPDTTDLPKIGVVSKIKSKIDLPNGNTRIVLEGIKRAKVYSYVNYSNEDEVLESIITLVEFEESDDPEETALLRKLIIELEKYVSNNPFISNSIISQIKGITNLDKLTDIIANFIPLNYEKKLSLILNTKPLSRAKQLITEINVEMAVLELENKIETDLKNELDETQKQFILREKIKIIKNELGETDSKSIDVENFNNRLNNTNIPSQIKQKLESEINKYSITPDVSPEISVIRNYIDYLLNIPWNKETKDETNLNKIEESLNKTHYALDEAKTRIIEYIAVKTNGKDVKSPIICLIGPPGVGKTTFAYSIASALKRKFSKISLGGMSDTAELLGHRRTYIGSNPGKIITSLIKCESMNPIILLDEVDKINKDYKGDPTGTLLDILDPTQNKAFVDSYIEEEVDLSKVLFILTANDINEIPKVLLDRLEIINISGYTDQEKVEIAKEHIIPTSHINNGLKEKTIIFEDESLNKIITNYTRESGVRELDRLISKITRKIITEYKKSNKKLTTYIVKEKDVVKYLKEEPYPDKPIHNVKTSGFLTGLAYTPYGGVTLEIEVASFKGEGKIQTTGTLGDVINESISIAVSYIKSHNKDLKIDIESFKINDYHINFREGGVPKDGPSAGTLITTALISYLKDKPISNEISMTGEITLNGDVLPIGGLKEKSLAAIKNGIKKVYIPYDNLKDINILTDEIKNNIEFIPVKNYSEIYKDLFE